MSYDLVVFDMHLFKSNLFLFIILALMLSTQGCSLIRYDVKGRVIDAETGKPIEGTAVTTHWFHYRLIPRLTGMTSGFESLAAYDTVTDSDGYFETTKHLGGEYKIGVYKKGYVGWCDKYIFNPEGKKVKRDDFDLEDDITIRLEPFKKHYSKIDHASFVVQYVGNNSSGPIFNNAIRDEIAIFFTK